MVVNKLIGVSVEFDYSFCSMTLIHYATGLFDIATSPYFFNF